MQVEGPQTPFEVFCRRCQVSFPVGTRRCLHCGGRVDRERFAPPPGASEQEEQFMEEFGEAEMPRGRFLSPFTVIWLLLAVAGALYRQCQ